MLAALSHRLDRAPPQAVRRTSYSSWSIVCLQSHVTYLFQEAVRRTSYSSWSIVCLQSHVTYLFQDSRTTVWSRIRKRVGVELVKDVMIR
jgi:hypothetical protein